MTRNWKASGAQAGFPVRPTPVPGIRPGRFDDPVPRKSPGSGRDLKGEITAAGVEHHVDMPAIFWLFQGEGQGV